MTTVLRCGTLFDGTGAEPIHDAIVVVEGGRIAAVGSPKSVSAPPSADVVDLGRRFVMPGLIDAHSHASIVPGRGDQIGQMREQVATQALRAPMPD